MFNLIEVKKEYLNLIKEQEVYINSLKDNSFKPDFLKVLEELKTRINNFKGNDLIILENYGKSIFKGGNVEVLGKHLFNNPFNKSLYPNGFFNYVGGSQRRVYLIIQGGIKQDFI